MQFWRVVGLPRGVPLGSWVVGWLVVVVVGGWASPPCPPPLLACPPPGTVPSVASSGFWVLGLGRGSLSFGFLGALVGSWLSLGGASLGLRDKRFARLVCFSALGAYVKLPPRSAGAGLQKRALTTEATQLRGEIT